MFIVDLQQGCAPVPHTKLAKLQQIILQPECKLQGGGGGGRAGPANLIPFFFFLNC